MSKTFIFNARLVDEDTDAPGSILISEGKIEKIFLEECTTLEKAKKLSSAENYIDAKELTLTPAFIDMHVHLRYPGQTQKEDLNSGLHAAAAGGFGTVIAMPNTNPVVSSINMALQNEKEADEIGLTKLYQVVSITKDFDGKTTSHLESISKEFVPVISEDGKDVLSPEIMKEGMKIAAKKNIVVSCHCEDPELAVEAKPFRMEALKIMKENNISASDYSPLQNVDSSIINQIDSNLTKANEILAVAEDTFTKRNIELAKEAGCHIHLAHVSTKKSMDYIREAKQSGMKKISCEVTPHHLGLSGNTEPNIRALVNPPLRFEEDRLALIEALKDGTADVISTDHAPHTAEDKASGSPGFTGIEASYGVCHTVLVKENNFSEKKLSQLMSANPARILGLNKGRLKEGYDADLTFVNPDESWIVDSTNFFSKGKATPFCGKTLTGKVKALFLKNKIVWGKL